MTATNTDILTQTQEPTDMYTVAQMKEAREARDGKPSFLAPLFKKPEQRTGTEWPWRHSTVTCLVNLPMLKKMAEAENETVETMIDRQRAMAMVDFLTLLESNFRQDTGSNDVKGWRLVVLRGCWLEDTTISKSNDEAVIYTDASYFFEKVSA